jgi:hypothetical protein
MLRNTHEVVRSGKNQYIVFVDPETEREEFIRTDDPKSEFETY